jgi:hypothetical protein
VFENVLLGRERLPPFLLFRALHTLAVTLSPDENQAVIDALAEGFQQLLTLLPDAYFVSPEEFKAQYEAFYAADMRYNGPTIPLHDALVNCGKAVTAMVLPIVDTKLVEQGLLSEVRRQIFENEAHANGLSVYERRKKSIPAPHERDEPPRELCFLYFQDTPLLEFFDTQVPFRIPRDRWPSHAICIAPPGHGKTQLLQSFIAGFIQEPDPPGLFVLDPHGDLFNTLRHRVPLGRLVVLDPDTSPPPLNFLDFGASTEPQVLQTFQYLMSSLSGGLSDKQGAIVPYLLKLLRLIPEASLETLRLIVDEKVKSADKSAFAQYIGKLSAVDQGFFHSQFYHSQMDATKQAIGWKIYSAMSSDTFREMFGAKTNSIDFDRLIAERNVVVVKGGRNSLGDDGMAIFLQYIIAQYFAAGMRRERIPPGKRHLCLMLVDEGSYVLNSPIIAKILVELRKFQCGFVAATQVFEQIGQDIKAAVLGATAIKIVGPVSFSDANLLSRELGVGTSPEFIRGMKAVERLHAEWAFYVSGMTDRAARVRVPYGVLERMPRIAGPTPIEAKPTMPLSSAAPRAQQPVPVLKPAEPREPAGTTDPLIKPGKAWD